MEALSWRGRYGAIVKNAEDCGGGGICHIFSEVTLDSLQLRSDYK